MPDFKFIPISGRSNFLEIFSKGKKFFGNNSRAVVCFKSGQDTGSIIKYAVAVSKKVSKKATVRNRIKRLLRESLKKTASDQMVYIERIVLNWNNAPKMPSLIRLNDVLPEITGLIQKINLYAINMHGKTEPETIN